MRSCHLVSCIVVLALLAGSGWAGDGEGKEAPAGAGAPAAFAVSPGGSEAFLPVASACPTFSWAAPAA